MKEEDDTGAKAPHGNSSDDEDDEELGARLRSASQVVSLVSRDAVCQPNQPGSDKAAFDEEERRSSVHSSRVVLKEGRHAGKASLSRMESGRAREEETQIEARLEEGGQEGDKVTSVA